MKTLDLMHQFEAMTAERFRYHYDKNHACKDRSIVYYNITEDFWMTVCEVDGLNGWAYDLYVPGLDVQEDGYEYRTMRDAFDALNDALTEILG